jgi:hypothetical protein
LLHETVVPLYADDAPTYGGTNLLGRQVGRYRRPHQLPGEKRYTHPKAIAPKSYSCPSIARNATLAATIANAERGKYGA